MKEAILSLEASPNRCPVTPENPRLRHLLYGNKPHVYRVIYRVAEKRKRVDILGPPRRTAPVHAILSAMVDGLGRRIRTRA